MFCLPTAGMREQFFHPIFTQPGKNLLVQPCLWFIWNIWNWKSSKSSGTKWAQWAANGPVWMPHALKTPCLIQFWSWMNVPFLVLALWDNKNWPPSMKVKKLEKNSESGRCKKAANGPIWRPKVLETICLIQFWGWKNSTFTILALRGNKNWPPSMKVEKLENS